MKQLFLILLKIGVTKSIFLWPQKLLNFPLCFNSSCKARKKSIDKLSILWAVIPMKNWIDGDLKKTKILNFETHLAHKYRFTKNIHFR